MVVKKNVQIEIHKLKCVQFCIKAEAKCFFTIGFKETSRFFLKFTNEKYPATSLQIDPLQTKASTWHQFVKREIDRFFLLNLEFKLDHQIHIAVSHLGQVNVIVVVSKDFTLPVSLHRAFLLLLVKIN